MAENAALFLSYSQIQGVIRRMSGASAQEELPLSQLAIAAAGAGAVTSFFLCVTHSSLSSGI